MTLLDVRNLSLAFGGVDALLDVSFEVRQGEIFSVIGPNGAGKTTLFNVISGVYRPDRGEIFFAAERINALKPAQRAQRGLQRTFQNLQIFKSMTVIENVMVGAHLRQRTGFLSGLAGLPAADMETAQARSESFGLIAALGLDQVSERIAGTLPYGMQKRLEIARALAAKPKVILMDEPAAGLNTQEKAEMADIIQRIAREHSTVVLVEHDMTLVMGISDRVLVLNFGRVLTCGKPNMVSRDHAVVEAYLGTELETNSADAPQG
jgi:branched-chain amino acid transport system ATP-binding protein